MGEPLKHRSDLNGAGGDEGVDDLDIDRGEFGYQRDVDGRVKWLHFWPTDCPCPLSAAITPQRNGNGATWMLSGAVDRPTLAPSVNAEGIWHGYLRDGVATRC
ncbi:MAG: hypothetical protein GC202_02010 [Alphaproteobacteria bacterium]|nr:hypothetical protein [Alphaproteobacteria bacterium]